ncbi:MAG: hypothetical protein AB7E05_05565 [Sphingobium sp.]
MQHAHKFETTVPDNAASVDALVAKHGSQSHSHVQMLLALTQEPNSHPLPLLADAVHYLCLLHGRFPGVVDHAARYVTANAARQWVIRICDAFAEERAYLTRLAVVVGPAPSTTSHSSTDSSVLQLRHTLDMLAQSERRGCALGAATTLALDWAGIRRLLDHAALRSGMEPPRPSMPDRAATLAILRDSDADELMARAIHFGGRQLLHQHQSLWSLLAERAALRAEK